MPRRNLSLLLLAIAVGLLCAARNEPNPFARYVGHGYGLIDKLSLEHPAGEELFAGAMRGMVAVLRNKGDEHSAYMEPTRANPLRDEMRQEFGGIGIKIRMIGDPPRLMIAEPPLPGTPAFAGGIRNGDQILTVDGEPIEGKPLEEILSLMRGRPGATLVLSLLHAEASSPVEIQLVREIIKLPSLSGDRRSEKGEWIFRLQSNPQIAHLRVTSFGNHSVEELEAACRLLVDEGVKGLILDVRNNAGGSLQAAIEMANLFLPIGEPIVSIRGRDGEVLETHLAWTPRQFEGIPLVVLIDRNTASASEIVAAALQDDGRSEVVGERSYGKGTVQQLLPVASGRSMLKITAASYWRPSGVNIHRRPGTPESAAWGVSPNKGNEVPLTEEELIAWYEWRQQRDLVQEADSSESESPLLAIEQDQALAKAVELLLASED